MTHYIKAMLAGTCLSAVMLTGAQAKTQDCSNKTLRQVKAINALAAVDASFAACDLTGLQGVKTPKLAKVRKAKAPKVQDAEESGDTAETPVALPVNAASYQAADLRVTGIEEPAFHPSFDITVYGVAAGLNTFGKVDHITGTSVAAGAGLELRKYLGDTGFFLGLRIEETQGIMPMRLTMKYDFPFDKTLKGPTYQLPQVPASLSLPTNPVTITTPTIRPGAALADSSAGKRLPGQARQKLDNATIGSRKINTGISVSDVARGLGFPTSVSLKDAKAARDWLQSFSGRSIRLKGDFNIAIADDIRMDTVGIIPLVGYEFNEGTFVDFGGSLAMVTANSTAKLSVGGNLNGMQMPAIINTVIGQIPLTHTDRWAMACVEADIGQDVGLSDHWSLRASVGGHLCKDIHSFSSLKDLKYYGDVRTRFGLTYTWDSQSTSGLRFARY